MTHDITGKRAVEIAASIEAAVREGRLAPGQQLPTVRALAARLDVSPTTVSAAYRTLRQRGLLMAGGRRGTSVREVPPLRTPLAPPLPRGARDLATGNPDPALLASLGPALRRIDPSPHLYTGEHQLPALRKLALHEFAADGIPADSLALVSGALDGMERVLQAHLRPGDRIALEDPAFSNVIDLCAALGLEMVPVTIDGRGPLPSSLAAALDLGVRALVVTPRAQNPTGAALDTRRTRELRRVLRAAPDLLLVEDDHAGAISGAACHTLVEASRQRWAVLRSVSKTLGPDLRLAFLAGDRETVARVEGRQRIGFRWVSHVLQRLVVELAQTRGAAVRLRTAARTYSRRRQALLHALAEHGIDASGNSGLNVWIPVPEESAVVQRLLAEGWAVAAGERFRIRTGPAIRVTTASLDPAEARRLAQAVAHCLDPGHTTAAA